MLLVQVYLMAESVEILKFLLGSKKLNKFDFQTLAIAVFGEVKKVYFERRFRFVFADSWAKS